jgi:hypothetical protein
VAEIGLEGAKPKRLVLRMGLSVGGEQGLGLDGVAEGRAGAVGLDGIDVGGREPGAVERLPDDALLGGAVGGSQPLALAILIDGRAADDGQDGMSVSPGVGQALQQQHSDAFGKAGAVGIGGERPATAIGSERALPAELDEEGRRRHDGDPTGQRQGALAVAQGLAGEVERNQGGAARGVDGDGRDPPARTCRRCVPDATLAEAADPDVALELPGVLGQA